MWHVASVKINPVVLCRVIPHSLFFSKVMRERGTIVPVNFVVMQLVVKSRGLSRNSCSCFCGFPMFMLSITQHGNYVGRDHLREIVLFRGGALYRRRAELHLLVLRRKSHTSFGRYRMEQ
jgi:hypothetical protein